MKRQCYNHTPADHHARSCPSRTARSRHKGPSSPRASAEMKPMARLNSTSVLHFIKEDMQYHAQNKVNKPLPKQRTCQYVNRLFRGENELAFAVGTYEGGLRTTRPSRADDAPFRSLLSLLMLILLTQRNHGTPTNPPRHGGRSRRFALFTGERCICCSFRSCKGGQRRRKSRRPAVASCKPIITTCRPSRSK